MVRRNIARIAVLLLALLWATSASAQTDRGMITGTITDAAGAAVAGATITITNLGTNSTVTNVTSGGGNYTAPALQVGAYRVKVEKAGFKTAVSDNVIVTVGNTTTVDVALEVGDVSQTVEVTSSAAQLQTESSKITTQVSNKQVDELPLVVGGAVRNAFDLALITPEAKQVGGDDSFALGGGQGGAFGITLDGVSAGTGRFGSVQWASVNTPSLDAITEFAVDTNGYKAEFGRASGGVLSFSSKSGTNDYHGTAYEFLRNNFFDARRFFEDKRGVLKQHDFGGSFGGPVWFPKKIFGPLNYDGHNKTFFFTSYEGFRNRVGAASGTFSVPTPEMYNGDFSKWVDTNGNLIPIYDPATTRTVNGVTIRDPFPGNIIPANRISPTAKSILSFINVKPTVNAAPGTSAYVRNNFVNTTGTQLDPWTKFSAKVDHNFSEKDKISGLYNYGYHGVVPGPDGFPGLPGVASTGRLGRQRSDVYRLNYTRVIRPNVVNYFYAGGNNWRELNSSVNATGGWRSKGVCIKGVIDCDLNFPRVTFSDFSTWGDSAGDGSENTIYSFGDDLSFSRGRHSFKAGYLYERIHYNGFGRQGISGWIDINRLSTSKPGDGNLATGGGNSFASFLLGEVFGGRLDSARFVSQQWRSHSMYFQDDWKVTNKLTFNLGLRYEFTLPPIEADDKFSDFDPNRPNPKADGFPGALIFAGEGEGRQGSRALVDGYYKGFGPRFGFAYQVDDKTVVRGGAGKSYGLVKTVNGSAHFAGAVLIYTPTSPNNIAPAFNLDAGFSGYTLPPSLDPSFSNGNTVDWWNNEATRLPEEYTWTLSIQREFGKGFVFETSYNADIGVHLVSNLTNYNQVPFTAIQQYGASLLSRNINDPAVVAAGIKKPYPSFNGSAVQALRRWPQYLQVVTGSAHGDKSGHSTYHAWVNKLEKRFSTGLTVQSSYVFSKLLTDTDRYGVDGNALDHFNRYLEKSIGAYDVTHNFKLSYIYELPFGKGKKYLNSGVASTVLGGWRFSGIQLYASGTPIGLGTSTSFSIFNNNNNRPNVTTYEGWINEPTNPDWRGNTRFFNSPAGYVSGVPTDRPGNATRFNPKARTRAALTENFSLAKTFAFTERVRMDFRWEAFNAFNRVRLATGSTNVQDPNFGLVRSQLNEPRRMQFALKLYF